MNKLRMGLTLVLLLAASGLVWAHAVHAQTFSSLTDSSQVINSSLYSAGQSVNIEGTINGDVYCAGQNVTIDATVHGDVLCTGQTVTVQGHIDGSLRIVAQTLTDQASVGRNFSAFAQTATITKQATVGGDVSYVGQALAINGIVGRDTAVRSTTLDVNGSVGRNVSYGGTRLDLWSKARISGNLTYNSPQSAMISKSAIIRGSKSHTVSTTKSRSLRIAFAAWAASFIYFFAAMLVFGLVFVLLMPQTVRAITEEPLQHLGRAFLNALGLVILEPIIIIVLFATFVGIPLALVLILLFLAIGAFSLPVTAFYIGTLIMSRKEHALLTMLAGMFVLVLLTMLPFIGVFAAVTSYLIGTGAIVLALRKYLPSPIYKVK